MPEQFIKNFKKNSQKAINRAICQAKGEEFFDEDALSPLGRVVRKLIPGKFRFSISKKNRALTIGDIHPGESAFHQPTSADAGAMTPRASNVTLKYRCDSVASKTSSSSYYSPKNGKGRNSNQSEFGNAQVAPGGSLDRSRNARSNNYCYL